MMSDKLRRSMQNGFGTLSQTSFSLSLFMAQQGEWLVKNVWIPFEATVDHAVKYSTELSPDEISLSIPLL